MSGGEKTCAVMMINTSGKTNLTVLYIVLIIIISTVTKTVVGNINEALI